MEDRESNNLRKNKEPGNNDSYLSEGEVNFGEAINLENKKFETGRKNDTRRVYEESEGEAEQEAEDKSSGEMSFNYFDVDGDKDNGNPSKERKDKRKNDAGDYLVKEDDFGDDYGDSF